MRYVKKKMLAVVFALVVILGLGYVTPLPVQAKTGKVLYTTSGRNITLSAGQSKTVTIVYKGTGSVYREFTKGMVSKQNWSGDWKGDKIKLKVTGLTAGKNTIIISADGTKQKVKFNVTVKGKNNYYELLKYIYKNGDDEEQDDGSYEMTYSDKYVDGNDNINLFELQESDNKIFISQAMYTEDTLSAVVFTVDDKLKVDMMSISLKFEDDETAFMAYVPLFDAKNYTTDKRYDFTIDHNTTSLPDESVIDFANDVLPDYLNLVNAKLESDTGIGLNDLGFDSYVAS